MKERAESFLRKLSFRGKPLSVDRFQWWLVIILTRLFGRDVDVGNGEVERIFPIVWGKKVHLLGLERRLVGATFSSQYTLQLRTRLPVKLGPGNVIPPSSAGSSPSVVHLVLGHLPPGPMDRILEYTQQLSDTYQVVLAYGGKRENFDQIRFPRKVFIEDPRLRGFSYRISYVGLMSQAREYLARLGLNPEWIFIADYDLLPLQPRYLDGMIGLMQTHGAGMGGKLFEDVSLTNKLFLTQAEARGVFERKKDLNGAGKHLIYHCIGCAFLIHRDCFDAILKERADLEEMYFELMLPTAAAYHGYRLLSFDEFSTCFQHVRYRPVFSSTEALDLGRAGAEFVHPLKESDAFIAAWSGREDVRETVKR